MSKSLNPASEYGELLEQLKERVRSSRLKAAVAVNSELILLYWDMGQAILERQEEAGWGARVVDRLAVDLRTSFPDMKGFSPRNLKYMRAFAQAWPERSIVQEVLAQIPWYHHLALLEKVRDRDARLFYVRAAVDNGWSRNVLVLQIESDLYRRRGNAVTNFERTLPAPDSDLARQTLKDPYVFDFLEIAEQAREREVERKLLLHIRDFLLELGVGFAFVGNQVRLEVGHDEFFVNLLFYHLTLRCFVVVELKNRRFKPEDVGKLNFYLSAVDDLKRHVADKPTIGLLLCKERDRVIVEYALRDVAKPIGVAEWQTKLVESLPTELEGTLPTIEQLEAELRDLPETDEDE